MYIKKIILSIFLAFIFITCSSNNNKESTRTRNLVDTIGFAQYGWQMDSLVARISENDKTPATETWKAVICPHDDYAYAGGLYYKTLKGIKAKTVVLIGVAHKARLFNLQDKIVFGSFDEWKSTKGNVKVSPLRSELLNLLSKDNYVVHDSMMQMEHSLESITTFLQYLNKDVETIPLLVPYMRFDDMLAYSRDLSLVLQEIMDKHNLKYGQDIAIVVSNDAIHYGDEDWGGDNLAPMGTDEKGTANVKAKELEIINNCLVDDVTIDKLKLFNEYTVDPNDYKKYKWTWCGRYSVPFGLMVANELNKLYLNTALKGTLLDYRSSYHNPHIKVNDLGMGLTAPANIHHWVGYAGIGYL
jgi:MEMO1 family protein